MRGGRVVVLAAALLAACDFPRPTDVPFDGPGDDDGGSDGMPGTQLGNFATLDNVSLRGDHSFHAHAIVGNKLTVFGGIDDINLPRTIEQAPILIDNALGDFGVAATAIPAGATLLGAAVVPPDTLYAVGGEDDTGNTTGRVDQASFDTANGSLNTFTGAGTTLLTSRSAEGLLVTSDFVYVFGGVHIIPGSSTRLASVERALIETGGTLAAFQSVTGVSLVTARTQFSTVVVDGFVYVIGGAGGPAGDALDSVERAPINSGGSIGTFATVTSHLVTPRLSHGAAVLGDSLYVIGGRDAGLDSLDSVERAPINSDGSIGAFATVTGVKLQTARYGHSVDVVGTSVYVVGGQLDIATQTKSVERARLQ